MTHVMARTRPAPVADDERAAIWTLDFLRYHVLVRVFDGDIARWRMVLRSEQHADAQFLAWLERRLQENPELLAQLRVMVDTAGLWPAPSSSSSRS
jgi:hypothetical protein